MDGFNGKHGPLSVEPNQLLFLERLNGCLVPQQEERVHSGENRQRETKDARNENQHGFLQLVDAHPHLRGFEHFDDAGNRGDADVEAVDGAPEDKEVEVFVVSEADAVV